MTLSKVYLVLLLCFGIHSSIQSQTKPTVLESVPSIGKNTYLDIRTPTIQKISHKIDYVIRYYDYCGPTKETFLYFDSTGRLIARYLGPWVRNAIAPPGPTFSTIYTILNPAPSFFFKGNNSQCYYYNARTKKTKQLPYNHQCESDGLVAVQRIEDHKCAYLNKKAEPICAFIYQEVGSFEHGIAIVKREGKEGVINTAGKEIVPCIYQDIRILDSKQIEAKKGYRDFDFFKMNGKLI
jgi:hypothetical protein